MWGNVLVRAGLITVAASLPGQGSADEIADFYRGKQVTITVGYTAGGGYDAYARVIARHMGRHIPGNPVMVLQNMPGAGSRVATNWLYNLAPKDGTALGTVGQNTPMDQALGEENIRFDVAKFNWIGNSVIDNNVTISWAGSGFDTIADVMKGGLICGGTGAASPTAIYPQIINNLLGAKIKIIAGYPGGGDVGLALLRGEVNCRGSNSWSSMKATMGDLIDQNKIVVLVEWGLKSDPAIAKYQGRPVPLIGDLAKTEIDRKALEMIVAGTDRTPVSCPTRCAAGSRGSPSPRFRRNHERSSFP